MARPIDTNEEIVAKMVLISGEGMTSVHAKINTNNE
jgi:hypothetical protein